MSSPLTHLPLRARKTRTNPALAHKLANLSLTLSPLVALPAGNPHPSFPRTLLAYHLLTEDELDGLAHWYHQSTPGEWTGQYPAAMNWDREWLDAGRWRIEEGADGEGERSLERGRGRGMERGQRRRRSSVLGLGDAATGRTWGPVEGGGQDDWFKRLLDTAVTSLQPTEPLALASPMSLTSPTTLVSPMTLTSPSYATATLSPPLATPTRRTTSAHTRPVTAAQLTDTERIAIKRRKVGKFIGLIGTETPDAEIEARMVAAMERAIERGREELREVEKWSMRRRKI